jgi:hypothetical protein
LADQPAKLSDEYPNLHRVLFLGLVPLKPGDPPDPNSPAPGYHCESEDEAIARIEYDPRKTTDDDIEHG